ncbi:MAG: iron-containing alcohol dehydrogenase [Alphaproteobacteria bacterium]|nr:iron-containing alcohol dehydrogenase [Alphaproteobacteria bacterium]
MAPITYLTTILFDHGAIRALPAELKAVGIGRPLVVTDRGVVAAGIAGRVLELIPQSNDLPRFEDTPSNPTETAVLKALELYWQGRCDGIVAVGGGSSMDLAKAVALLATHPGPLATYAMSLGGLPKITSNVAPVIAIPTTAGTGSEVGRGALVTLDDGRKLGFVSPHLIPRRAVCDPELTLGLPPLLTAATGMDAMAHCIETFLSPRINPPADAIALDGAERAIKWIERATTNGKDRDARWNMMMASMEGAMAFQKGLGAVHGMSHPLGAIKEMGLHHGTLNAVILPAVLRYNEGHVGDKYARLRKVLGLKDSADLAVFIEELNARLKLPANLGAMGVKAAMIPALAEQAVIDHSTPTNPRPVGKAEYETLYREALG